MSVLSKMLRKAQKGLLGEQYQTKLYEHTEAGKRLADLSRTGIYTPKAISGITRRVASRAGGVAAQRTAGIRGRLATSGMEGSIAGIRALSAPGMQFQRSITDISRDLSTENELSKQQAISALAEGKTASRDIRRGEREAYRSKYVGGALKLAGTVGGAAIGGIFGAPMIGAQIGGQLGGLAGGGGVDTSGMASTLSRLSFKMPENLGDMPYEEFYTWAIRQGMNIEDANDLYFAALARKEVSGMPVSDSAYATPWGEGM